jgi:indole-3-glycerol phosphate synthase
MNILDTIIAHKKNEVAEAKEMQSIKSLESSAYFTAPKISLKKIYTSK